MSISNDSIFTVVEPTQQLNFDNCQTDSCIMDINAVSFKLEKALQDSIENSLTVSSVEDWHQGMEGSSRQNQIENNSVVLTVIVVLFILMSLSFKECKRLFIHYFDELRNNKKRENAFDEHTDNESVLSIFTIIQYIVYGGILLYEISMHSDGESINMADNLMKLLSITGLFGAYYLFQIAGYATVGYTFTDKEDTRRWLKAYNASQALAGAIFIIPALLILFYPATYGAMSVFAIIIFIISRLCFIIKGFSIFYNNIFSLIYFILYLCSLEFIPVIFMYKLALLIV